jgi:hypothetical protein
MEPLCNEITAFLYDFYPSEYYNPHQVGIEINDNGMVNLVCKLQPNTKHSVIEAFWEAPSVSELILYQKLQNVKDLGKIAPLHLIDLYNRGLAYVYCNIGYNRDYVLFKRIDSACFMILGDDRTIQVRQTLSTPDEFLQYTRVYYKKNKGKYSIN